MLQGLMGGVTSRLIGVMLTLLGPFYVENLSSRSDGDFVTRRFQNYWRC